ncbi:MAG: NADP-dependent oxidoreductase [Mycobacteriaceae bacterium]|uniref:NADP-dependent oxidoreductase n=1 Tax=Corynebacterium sp. TaxID=1720 RepID=UPI003F9E412D
MSTYIEQEEFNDPIRLARVEREEPLPGHGEVLVRVTAAGLNPVDWKIATGQLDPSVLGLSAPTGYGNDFAGEVQAIGEGVSGFAVGDRVFGGARARAVAEHLVIDSDQLHLTPDGVSDVQASTLDIAAPTAWAAIDAVAPAEGETVLIGGAAGGVGVLAVQFAVQRGARVIATASEHNHGFLRELGAEPTTYGDGLVDRVRGLAPDGVDAAVDLQGSDTAAAAVELGVAESRISAIAAGPDAPEGIVSTGGFAAEDGVLDRIAADIGSGRTVVEIARTFPISETSAAVDFQRTGHVRGKVVVTV